MVKLLSGEGGVTDSTDLKIFNKTLHSRRMYVFVGIAILAVSSFLLGQLIVDGRSGDAHDTTAFWFIGLLVIFMTALATTSTVFAGLRMSNSMEAFGLPSGSIRALLAVGIMVLFVVFGLQYMQATDRTQTLAGAAFQSVVVTPETIEAETARYTAMNVAVVKVSPTRIDLYRKVNARSQEDQDLYKQLLTAIVTLLTTVIGFYFGSRSASENLREEDRLAPPGGPPSDMAVERGRLGEQFEKLNADLTARGQDLERVEKLPPATDPGDLKTRAEMISGARSAASAIEAHRKAAEAALAKYDAAAKAMAEEARADIRKVHESDAREALKAARAAIEQVAAAYPGFGQQVDTLSQATAEG